MGYGRGPVPDGTLPVYSVGSMQEAELLLTMACQTNLDGEFVARELAQEQTLANLQAFSDRLHRVHAKLSADTCDCNRIPKKRRAKKPR